MTALRSAIYTGELAHARRRPVRHAFRYPVYLLLLDVDELPALAARSRLFRHNRAGLVALHDGDYAGAAGVGLRASVERFARAGGLAAPLARIELLTHARVLGYAFNPVSFFYCYAADDTLAAVVAEVNNTYGQRRRYLLHEGNRVPAEGGQAYAQTRDLYVSPFVAMGATWRFEFRPRSDVAPAPAPTLAAREVRVETRDAGAESPFFTAHLSGETRALNDRALASMLVRYPLMPWKVLAWIYWEAFRIGRTGLPRHPPPRRGAAREATP